MVLEVIVIRMVGGSGIGLKGWVGREYGVESSFSIYHRQSVEAIRSRLEVVGNV